MLGMLALTAVHDIMKVEALLPKVDAKHGPYEGFKEGVVINDHDVALGYALGRVSDVAPPTRSAIAHLPLLPLQTSTATRGSTTSSATAASRRVSPTAASPR